MTSRIRLYNIPDLMEEKNNIVEELGTTYLVHFTPQLDFFNFQYQRLEIVKTIKINLSQSYDVPNPVSMFNYCRIDAYGDDGLTPIATIAPAFYFVQDVEQESKNTLRLHMKLDVLNTFYSQWKDKMTNGTYIARGHEDRFKPFLLGDVDNTLQLVSIFNRVPEGDNMPLYEKESARAIVRQSGKGDTDANPLKFYLIYRTSEDGLPCIDLCANRELLLAGADQGGGYVEFDVSDLIGGRYYYLMGDFSFSYYYEEDTGQGTTIPTWSSQIDATDGILQYYKNGGYIYIRLIYGNTANSYLADLGKIRIIKGRKIYYSSVATLMQTEIATFNYSTINAGDYPAKYLGDINQLDKTDNKIVKVIECPYCPISYSYDSTTQVYTFSNAIFNSESELEYPKFLRSYNVGKEFPKVNIGYLDLNNLLVNSGPASTIEGLQTDPKVAAFLPDPKIYTSAYFAYTLVYDSFAKQIKLENFTHSALYFGYESLQFYYKQSANVSSALLFEAKMPSESDPEGGFTLSISEENFPRILVASRNNEVALFSSSYLDYLKNGFNYDKKKLQENITFQGGMALLQTLGSILSFAFTPATGGASAAAGFGLAVGAASSFANQAHSAMQGAQDLEQKINMLKAQSFSVSSIDDLDLFNEYGKNKLQIVKYQVSENDLNRIKTRFQYFGYAVDKYANPYPFYFTGRHNFNFLKCDPVFKTGSIAAIPEDFLNEISDKLRAGVTIWHSRFYERNAYNNYALNKDYENIEESVLAIL